MSRHDLILLGLAADLALAALAAAQLAVELRWRRSLRRVRAAAQEPPRQP
ncbi:hypothetical protein HEP84_25815 [Streptomyces sp. RLB1-33]|nr:hypothetical protein [Streptomyces sp. RLB1-33]QIY72057.1 hypothetical protein HEP84_25815 [Streptomyces sp. RLB1-33]